MKEQEEERRGKTSTAKECRRDKGKKIKCADKMCARHSCAVTFQIENVHAVLYEHAPHTHTHACTTHKTSQMRTKISQSAFKFRRIDLRLTVCCQRIRNYTFAK